MGQGAQVGLRIAWAGLSAQQERRGEFTVLIRFVFDQSQQIYEYRHIYSWLTRNDIETNSELIRQIMAMEGLVACQPRTTIPTKDAVERSDLAQQDFTVETPGRKWGGDITSIPTGKDAPTLPRSSSATRRKSLATRSPVA